MGFSVLLSVYAKENAFYLEQSLESIVKQTREPNQIVIVKDGKLSADLETVIEKYRRTI